MKDKTVLTITTNTPEEATLLIEILAEIRRAKFKHPVWPDSHVERAAIVAEEAGEVIREANHLREGCGNEMFASAILTTVRHIGKNRAIIKALQSADDKLTLRFRKFGRIDFYRNN